MNWIKGHVRTMTMTVIAAGAVMSSFLYGASVFTVITLAAAMALMTSNMDFWRNRVRNPPLVIPRRNQHWCHGCDMVHGCHCKFVGCYNCGAWDCPVLHNCERKRNAE